MEKVAVRPPSGRLSDLLTDDVSIDVRVCQTVEKGRGMVGWMEEGGWVEERHWLWEGVVRRKPVPVRLWLFKEPHGGRRLKVRAPRLGRREQKRSQHRATHPDSSYPRPGSVRLSLGHPIGAAHYPCGHLRLHPKRTACAVSFIFH